MTDRFIGYGRQRVGEDDIAAVVEVLRSERLTQGPAVERFEQAFARQVGAAHAVAVSNGTGALHIACLAAGLGSGGRGVTSTLTFVACANAIRYCGGEVALCDIDPDGLGISPASLTAALAKAPDTKLLITVDLAGLASAAEEIREIAGARTVIEDASHALGGNYADGRPVGSCAHADMTVFSFHPVKSITAAEGGMVTTNNSELHRRLRLFRDHGIERNPERFVDQKAAAEDDRPAPWHYEQQALGYNYRLSDIHAALGLSQLGKLDAFIGRRREIVARYDAAFAGLPGIGMVQDGADARRRSAHHLYVLRFDFAGLGIRRSAVMDRLEKHGIGTQVHYIPIHRHPYHRGVGDYARSDFPAAEAYYESCLTLPLYPALGDAEVDRVIDAVSETVSKIIA